MAFVHAQMKSIVETKRGCTRKTKLTRDEVKEEGGLPVVLANNVQERKERCGRY